MSKKPDRDQQRLRWWQADRDEQGQIKEFRKPIGPLRQRLRILGGFVLFSGLVAGGIAKLTHDDYIGGVVFWALQLSWIIPLTISKLRSR